jgi:hypothetical protein
MGAARRTPPCTGGFVKLVECEYKGLEDGIWTKVRVKGVLDGRTIEGTMLFENDGRDIELEDGLEDVKIDWEQFYSDENDKLLSPVLIQGYLEWESQ